MKLKIMTYNIASCRNYKLGPDFRPVTRDIDLYAKAMQELAPDICGLNEVDYKLPRSCCIKMAKFLGDALGYESAFGPAVTWGLGTYGNGFISKYPIKDVEVYPIPDPPAKTEDAYYETRAILHTILDIEGRDVDVFVTHFGLARAEAQSAADTLVELIKRCQNPVVLMGDFNLTPTSPLYRRLAEVFDDSAILTSDPLLTFPSHAPDCKIDYVFTKGNIKATRVISPAVVASDHLPILVEVTL